MSKISILRYQNQVFNIDEGIIRAGAPLLAEGPGHFTFRNSHAFPFHWLCSSINLYSVDNYNILSTKIFLLK